MVSYMQTVSVCHRTWCSYMQTVSGLSRNHGVLHETVSSLHGTWCLTWNSVRSYHGTLCLTCKQCPVCHKDMVSYMQTVSWSLTGHGVLQANSVRLWSRTWVTCNRIRFCSACLHDKQCPVLGQGHRADRPDHLFACKTPMTRERTGHCLA